ncbi:lipopolysaccharide biosynthesis protein [Celerinatantimonas yamalensis]|uniref:Oligosaccharide flippase family protein n=1 Tax=Celerinatantimonas yamalensis TaxID=559956 RepID=A0ABW9G5L4_9GAMM
MKTAEVKQRFIKLFSVNLIVKGASFLLLPVYLNLMSQEEFGNYSYIISIVGMMAFVFGIGQHATLNRFYHSSEYTRDALVENVHLILFTSFLFFGFFIILFKSYFIELFLKHVISDVVFYSMLILAMLTALNQILMSFLYQSENIKLIQRKSIVEFFIINVSSLCLLYFVSLPKSELRILAVSVSYVMILAFYYRFFLKKHNFKFKNSTIAFYKRGISNGFPMAVGSLSVFFINFGDRFVIEKKLDNSLLGVFSFAMVIIGILMLVFQSFQNVWLPYFFKEKNLDLSFQRAYKIILIFFGVSVIMGISFYGLVYILANYFIDHSYIKSLGFLWLLVFASFFQIAGMTIAGFYQIFEKNHIVVPINILAGIINIFMNYYFIERYGILGSALSTVLISVMLFFVHFYLVNFYRKRGNYGEYFTKYKIQ